ncbi:SERTA domain-containing protein 3 [Marasmius crinis-equi]|uniref:SERTA domain-containing protein 3 n=1 Tax=Marasmius crinis-equi TaxID=585013 RepID=A0ABR3FIP5_9AGAR
MRRRVANGIFSFEKGGEAWNLVMAKLAGMPLSKPGHQRTAFNMWAKQNESLIDMLVEKKQLELLEAKKRLLDSIKETAGQDNNAESASKQNGGEVAGEQNKKGEKVAQKKSGSGKKGSTDGNGDTTKDETLDNSSAAHTKRPRVPERPLPTGGVRTLQKKLKTDPTTSTTTVASTSSQRPSGSSSAAPSDSKKTQGGPGNWPSTINTVALRRPRTYLAMSTGGMAPLTIAQRAEREARRAQAEREGGIVPLGEMTTEITRQEILERREHSPGWETDGSLGQPLAPCERRRASTAKQHVNSDIEALGDTGKGSASSPIHLDSPIDLVSPKSSWPPTPDVEQPQPQALSARDASPSASSVASAISPQLRPTRVQASSPINVEMPPSTQPRRKVENGSFSHLALKTELKEPGPEVLRRTGKRAHKSGRDSGRSKRRRVERELDTSEDELSTHLEQVAPSSPLPLSSPPLSPSPSTTSKSHQVLSHVEILRRAKGKGRRTSRTEASVAGTTKYNATVDLSTVDTSSYTFELPEDAPRYLHLTMEMCSAVKVEDEGFLQVLKLWVEFEQWAGFVERGKLTTKGRPPQVSIWIAHGQRSNFVPDIQDVREYGKQLMGWWRNCTPDWRVVKGSNELRRGRGNWEDLRVSGVNGLTSVVAALAWWMGAIAKLSRDKPQDQQFYELQLEAFVGTLKDVKYSLQQLLAVAR